MQWDAGRYAGFSSAQPWLPVAADYDTHNVVVQSGDPASLLNLYRRLLWYRRQSPSLFGGSYRPLDVAVGACFVYLRAADDQTHLIALNFTDQPQRFSVPDRASGHLVLTTHLDREGRISLDPLELRAHEGVVVRL
jgi:alpha-glucosidase